MDYGYMERGQLIRVKTETKGRKPLVYTPEPEVDRYHATSYSWAEQDETIDQVWSIHEIDQVDEPIELTDSEALEIILGGGNT
jgi:hypothetical protein